MEVGVVQFAQLHDDVVVSVVLINVVKVACSVGVFLGANKKSSALLAVVGRIHCRWVCFLNSEELPDVPASEGSS